VLVEVSAAGEEGPDALLREAAGHHRELRAGGVTHAGGKRSRGCT
jgi:hypothetical protein